ncbi:MAG TPA: hypothetical protein VKF59_05895 [Candidatus Dormibacteraeota bacterium]|nr:hypothetical protein [Candidatus Dormibacteraeota bacterium]
MLVEYARNVVGDAAAAHAELDPDAQDAVVVPLVCSLFGERREVRAVPGTRAAAICGSDPMDGFHFCGYGLAGGWVSRLVAAGLVVSGYAEDGSVEIVELPGHPFYMASLFQPQVGPDGAPDDAPLHPLLTSFAEAVAGHRAGRARA